MGVEFKGTADANEPYIDEGDKVEAYAFYPDTIRVQKGQTVTIHFLGVNGGGGHPVNIENYVPDVFRFYRNQTVTKTFVADQAGVFAITCYDHQPSMNGFLIVEEPLAAPSAALGLTSTALLGLQAALFVGALVLVLLAWRRGQA
ncbi:MAG: hypothetical protein LN413_01865 [Candidatus Thermoplasmatota archaeon]|nr:hypothetical protein [Candidatus Thermoplasmatota archaeon]